MAAQQVTCKNGVVVAGLPGSAEAGLRMLRAGGNAVDAGVATVLTLAVTDEDQFCFGGEVPMLIHLRESGHVVAISGQGPAPANATLDAFDGLDCLPGTGLRSAAVPSALATCLLALDQFGTMTFADVSAPMMELLASKRLPWFPRLGATIVRLVGAERHADGGRSAGIEAVRFAFYEGAIGEELVAWNREEDGLFALEDLKSYRARIEEPVRGTYRGIDFYKCGFWTQGPSLVQALNALEGFDLASMGATDAAAVHVTIEAIKLAFADRDTYYADPDFESLPADVLLSKEYASLRRGLIDEGAASLAYRPGDPRGKTAVTSGAFKNVGAAARDKDTTTCVAADRFGNMFAATPSGWGTDVEPGATGVVLGTRLISSNLWPGHPNVLTPGKRPRITLTPTLAMKDGRPFMVISVAGGDQQEQTTLQTVLNIVDHGLSAQEAADVPRFGTEQFIGSFRQTPIRYGSLTIEDSAPGTTVRALRDRGHEVELSAQFPSRLALIKWRDDGTMEPGGDLCKQRTIALWE